MRGLRKAAVAFAAITLLAGSASAQPVVGWYGGGNWAPAIAANGYVNVPIVDFTTFDFSTVDIVAINNPSNSAVEAAISGRLADLTAFATGGGKIVIHDRWVGDNSWIPGAAGITLVRSFAFDQDLEVVNGANTVITGPFGTIGNTTLDGGNSSNHGWATAGSLPGGTVVFLSAGPDASQAAAFAYGLGSGLVYYATIPLDFYQSGFGVNPPEDAVLNVYAPNVLAYVGGAAATVPEPATVALLGGGLALVGLVARRRATA